MDEGTRRLCRAFYSAGFSYCMSDGKSPTPEEVQAAKETLKLIKAGRLEQAAIEAGKTQGSLEIFEAALNLISKKTTEEYGNS